MCLTRFIPVTAFWTATQCAQPGSPGLTPGRIQAYDPSSPAQAYVRPHHHLRVIVLLCVVGTMVIAATLRY